MGFSYTWDNAKPRGEKIISGSMKLNGTPIDPALQYRVTANSFLAGGSEGMGVFREGTERQVSVLDLEALSDDLGGFSVCAAFGWKAGTLELMLAPNRSLLSYPRCCCVLTTVR